MVNLGLHHILWDVLDAMKARDRHKSLGNEK